MIYEYQINGLTVQTGDLICTTDGGGAVIKGQFWRLLGKLLPGDVDHIVAYVGPGGHCVEAGPKGVSAFDISGSIWDSEKMADQRGMLMDEFYGIAFPVGIKQVSEAEATKIRENVAEYCLAQLCKPYNINFIDSSTENAFYCSQLAYLAYLKNRIDLNTRIGIPEIPLTESIIFPQEIWSGCAAHGAALRGKV